MYNLKGLLYLKILTPLDREGLLLSKPASEPSWVHSSAPVPASQARCTENGNAKVERATDWQRAACLVVNPVWGIT